MKKLVLYITLFAACSLAVVSAQAMQVRGAQWQRQVEAEKQHLLLYMRVYLRGADIRTKLNYLQNYIDSFTDLESLLGDNPSIEAAQHLYFALVAGNR